MSDHLLRLARIVESIASGDGPHWPTEDVRQLIRDLEAAPQPERPPSSVETALREFAGFISGDIAELHGVEVPRIAESVNRYLNASGPHVPPAPERRTITRKQYEMAVGRISSSRDELSASVCALICLRELDLTVEDA